MLQRFTRAILPALLCAAAGGVVVDSGAAAASSEQARAGAATSHSSAGPQTVVSVPITGGTSALYSSYQVTSASTGGAIVAPLQRSGDGLLQPSDAQPSLLRAGWTSLAGLHPTTPGGFESVAFNISGSMVTDFEADFSSGAQDVWWYDVATGKSGLKTVPSGLSPAGPTPDGYLITDETTIEHVDVLTGATTKVMSTKNGAVVTAGPAGAIVITGSLMQYVTYSPITVRTLDTTGNWECDSATTSAAGCEEYAPGARLETVARFPLAGGKPVTEALPPGPEAPVLVTPKVTAWVTCGATSCDLKRVPWSGGGATAITLPPVSDGAAGVQVAGDTFYWGQLDNRSSSGGLFDLSDTSTRPAHVVSAPLSPVAATNVSVSGNTVSWIDNAEPGLGVWTRSITGSPTVTLGKAALVAQAGFVYTDESYGLGLGIESPGPTVVYSSYRTQPTSYPLALWAKTGAGSTEFSTFEYAEPDTDLGPPIDVSGDWVLYECFSGWYLYNTSTHDKVTLPTGIATYALGGGDVAWVAQDGSVWEEPVGTTSSTEIFTPPSGETVGTVNGLAVNGSVVAWSYEWSSSTASGSVADYVDPAVSSATKKIPDPSDVSAMVLSAEYLGFELFGNGGETLEVINLPSGSPAETLVAHNSFDLSISGHYAVWIGGNSLLPFAGAL